MIENVIISVVETVGDGICVSSDNGQKVYNKIEESILNERDVILSFQDVTDITSAFLNAAIGQLFGKFSENEIRLRLSVTDISEDDKRMLNRVVDRAQSYFKNPKPYIEAANEMLGDSDE
jgi:hypothetical protein